MHSFSDLQLLNKMKSYLIYSFIFIALVSTGCKKDFFNIPPQDALSADNFYQNTEQVQASTIALYNSPWFDWNAKASWCISELLSGNAHTYSPDVINFGNFSVTGDNTQLLSAWNSLYSVIAQSNTLINNLKTKVPASVPAPVVNNAIGEARFMRAMAYFYLVRIWGDVPIIENSLDYVGNYQINTNPVTDVYKFIINDLKYAEQNCDKMIRTGSVSQGKVSSGSASALLAKVYLYMRDYSNARLKAEQVINSGEFKLYGIDIAGKTYADLFKTANNNNEESVAAIQWLGGSSYGHGNALQSFLAFNSEITGTGDGYGSVTPSIDLLTAFEPGDLRRKPTVMMQGDVYPEINQAKGGYTLPAGAVAQGMPAFIKKYVVGTPADNGGKGAAFSTGNNTYLMRYADVLLIEAEAVLAGAERTADDAALIPFNKIRRRAGLIPKTSITIADIYQERRMEFVFEADYWFDLGRLDGFNVTSHPKAIAIISNQERGIYSNTTPVVIWGQKYTPTDANFRLPYPTTETILNPKLLLPPVPYNFK
ncbi:membrane protein [Pedobacter zeae]|uniref:Membrane protein n=2 Tax=Pedobacter zeae TaxID=1737356 RepID=A0ABQ1XNE3_9SPHI|nr:membrane protein [Pedobacter zeae]